MAGESATEQLRALKERVDSSQTAYINLHDRCWKRQATFWSTIKSLVGFGRYHRRRQLMRSILIAPLAWLLIQPHLLRAEEPWTDEEIQGVGHLFKAFDLSQQATRLANQGEALTSFSVHEYRQILKLQREALTNARLVGDGTLAKVHPEMPQQFRNLFQRALELKIRNLEADGGDIRAEVSGSALMDKWADWYNANSAQFQLPGEEADTGSFLSEPVIWYWNGWGILFTLLLSLNFVSMYFIPEGQYRSIYGMTGLAWIVLNIALCGWISGLASYPIAFIIAGLLRPVLRRDRESVQ